MTSRASEAPGPAVTTSTLEPPSAPSAEHLQDAGRVGRLAVRAQGDGRIEPGGRAHQVAGRAGVQRDAGRERRRCGGAQSFPTTRASSAAAAAVCRSAPVAASTAAATAPSTSGASARRTSIPSTSPPARIARTREHGAANVYQHEHALAGVRRPDPRGDPVGIGAEPPVGRATGGHDADVLSADLRDQLCKPFCERRGVGDQYNPDHRSSPFIQRSILHCRTGFGKSGT